MALLSCLRCGTRFAVGLLRCPHCLSEDFEEADVPKNTTWGGASYPEDPATGPVIPAEPEVAVPAAEVVTPPPEPPVKPEPAPGPEVPADPEPVVLKADLQDQARELGLPVSGTKAQLADAVAAATEPEAKAAPSLSGPAKSG